MMGGVIGGLSAKLAFAAGSLLLASRVGTHRTAATIDPSLPKTIIAASLAQQIGSGGQRRTVDIDQATIRIPALAVADDAAPPLTIGADVLREIALRVDLKRMRLELMNRSALRRATKDHAPIVTTVDTNDCLTIDAADANGAPITLALIGTADAREGTRTRITLAGLSLNAVPLVAGRCAASRTALDWSSFAGKQVFLDLGQGRLWIF